MNKKSINFKTKKLLYLELRNDYKIKIIKQNFV